MILETASLKVRPGSGPEFEAAFEKAARVLPIVEGYLSHKLQRSIDTPDHYLIMIEWQTREHHMEGFRNSPQYQEWREWLHGFFASGPDVEHYESVMEGSRHD